MNKSFYFLERHNNDNRKSKLVHPFDGRINPLQPSEIKPHAEKLAEKLCLDGVDYILGFAEGGLIPAYSIAEATGKPFVGSYRVRLKTQNEIHFIEAHSERANHFIYGLKTGDSVVIIEDEITTGETLYNAVVQLNSFGVEVKDIGVYVLNCAEMALSKLKLMGYQVKFLYTTNNDEQKFAE